MTAQNARSEAATNVTDAFRASPAWPAVVTVARLERARRAAEAASTLGLADQRLLWLFSDGRPRTLREISEELGLEQSTVNRQVNAALAAGRVRRFREPGQSAHLFLATEEALDRFAQDVGVHLAQYEAGLAAVPEPQRADFLANLTAFVAAYEAAGAQAR